MELQNIKPVNKVTAEPEVIIDPVRKVLCYPGELKYRDTFFKTRRPSAEKINTEATIVLYGIRGTHGTGWHKLNIHLRFT
jgi:hypothetical protein